MITEIEEYFSKGCGRCNRFDTPQCSTKTWNYGIEELRRICLGAGLTETVKWGHPCYVHNERNIAIIGAFKSDFRLTFFNGSLLKDTENILERRGENSAAKDIIRFTRNEQVGEMEPIISAYLGEAITYAHANIRPAKVDVELELPEELIHALDNDTELGEAFHALTPGRQRSYVLNLNSAKASATRIARIAKFRRKILLGKGALER